MPYKLSARSRSQQMRRNLELLLHDELDIGLLNEIEDSR